MAKNLMQDRAEQSEWSYLDVGRLIDTNERRDPPRRDDMLLAFLESIELHVVLVLQGA